MSKVKKYIADDAELMKEWDWEANKPEGIEPNQITFGSSKYVHWKCDKGHIWKATPNSRTGHRTKTGCPVCGKIRQGSTMVSNLIAKNGSFADNYPDMLFEWDYNKNINIDPNMISSHSNKKVWWLCQVCQYSWSTTVTHRVTKKSGCPVCANQVVNDVNCIETVCNDLLKIWNYEKNVSITPKQVTPGSNKKVWWKCEKKHEWQAKVNAIANGGSCPVCLGKTVLEGYNDLATTNPTLAAEWHPTLNGNLYPNQVTAGSSSKKIWWLCPNGHAYQAIVSNRSSGSGCPICNKEKKTSFPEQAIFYYLKQNTTAINRYLLDGKTEIDVYLPDLNVGIEYDGYYYHNSNSTMEKEAKKDSIIRNAGITLFRVKEIKRDDEMIHDDFIVYCYPSSNYSYLSNVLDQLMKKIFIYTSLKMEIDFDISRDEGSIYEQYIESQKENSLAVRDPELANQWHPDKNGFITPDKVSFGSSKVFWWKGECGHEWKARVDSRKNGNGCPICTGKQILIGFNDLESTYPLLCQEWHPTKNIISPQQVTKGSKKKVWWLCNNGHTYQSTVCNRVFGQACPFCSVEKRIVSNNINRIKKNGSIYETHPQIAYEWNYMLNGELKPNGVTKGSSRKVWWTCQNGHDYKTAIYNRTNGRGCPICAGNKIVTGVNDLATVNPQLAAEWNFAKNDELSPYTISQCSGKKVWWKCLVCGNEWKSIVANRTKGSGCPVCAKNKRKKTATDDKN